MPYAGPTAATLQVALDFLNTDQALRAAEGAVAAGAQWLEIGTPLIKSEGLSAVRALRAAHPKATIIADMKVMDAGRTEVEAAHKAGADIVMVLAAATDATIQECIEAGKHVGVAIGIDLVGTSDPAARAKEVEAMGADLVSVHTPIDQQMEGKDGQETLKTVASAVSIPVSCAGGLSPATIPDAIGAGARVCIVGGAITKAPDPNEATSAALKALTEGVVPEQVLYQRAGLEDIDKVLARVSTANLSDAMHRGGAIVGLTDRNPGVRLEGPVRTVICPPGDWSKPVQAIDLCQPGEVLVIDASGQMPALWGGLATRTAAARKLGGVIINGACRDLEEIEGGPLPLWSTHACPHAGEPKGIGAYDQVVDIGGQHLRPGDYVVGDRSGLVVIPQERLVEVANRAQDVMEREQRYAAEIDEGRTLAEVAELSKWENAQK